MVPIVYNRVLNSESQLIVPSVEAGRYVYRGTPAGHRWLGI